MRKESFLFFICTLNLLINSFFCYGGKVKKNKHLRNLLKTLTDRIETNDGENEYARLTQTPVINMNLEKTIFKTSLQDILVEPYAEKIKEIISKNNYEISKEKENLDEIRYYNDNLDKINNILIERENEKKKKKRKNIQLENKLRNKYFHYLQDQDYGFSIFPVYKTFESNPLHFDNNIISSLLPHELLDKGILLNKQILENSEKILHYPERGDTLYEI
ncbi:hypothetical protein PFAG_02169 [Plasmodium falciparum Santa Lucia]|uniref:Uncharacterized protein n=14 Tax=Plasmodium falciparum TaxID=5833 RepID=Q8IBA6_PLAF7|nr:conserved Plasmodium protein, unknown function [Plasmodium falciparum 3D7]ETW18831.1 hypothetical protein PFFVO_02223 [Plasmodium falciparum Vietnam Oak-Knoll (FVO)]ETW30999.1 hypothetical protein PFFCH_01533 [Plasmodium falciparum FCH/4]ETW36991.1 hypothetical protein PFTANZ_02290 [Plasmodium falciparum Tanzania (2000708)]ETW43426.1 hypothetical protein PFNF135_02338 [Plasmodium falciparum NF135/5.C10]ETW46067.1 hypothetical protein PFMALIP_05869 [Plasmodium falciparum MaliPS096_E11]ETW52|eukprot:XP_001349252.1 conserved Plasmodium protein, unknown function [Plasmodium falciparum 3D7]